ncbi:helix-turn-helix domain-containing protein [Haloferax sp. DFSO52]|uniref:helix-turn-helix domain-containing protein n=1 Tax=Haloferax sp. DFSO52 TaxID=3388505 RepID=UPI003A8BB330
MGAEASVTGYEVELGCPIEGSSLGAALADSDRKIAFVSGLHVSETPIPYFTALGSDLDAIDDVLDSHECVEQFELVESGGSKRLYRCEWTTETDGLISVIRRSDGIIRRMEGTSDGWVISVFFPTNTHASEFHNACLDRDIDITIRRVERSRLDERRLRNDGLSDKQLTALELAYSRGYFETPKESSLTEIASEIDITEQAMSQRLRRALNTLVRSSIDDIGGDSSRREK